jgi:hypothetical protein
MTPMEHPSGSTLPAGVPETHTEPETAAAHQYHWYHKMSALLFIAFCLEVGCFLLIFPWTEYWDANFLVSVLPAAPRYWNNMYVRGGVSGLGVVNLYICLAEILRLRRFSRQ